MVFKPRKVPLRICLGCQEHKPKKELLRIVRTPQGEVLLDLTGKKAGRGVYICPQSGCMKKALKGKKLEKNLQRFIPEHVMNEVMAYLEEYDRSRP